MTHSSSDSKSSVDVSEALNLGLKLANVFWQDHFGPGRLTTKSQYDECATSIIHVMVCGERSASQENAVLERKILKKVPSFSSPTDVQTLTKNVHSLARRYFYFDIFANWVTPAEVAFVRRLERLHKNPPLPTVAVFGTYNHGKSLLLNALTDEYATDQKEARFKFSDARETIKADPFEKNGIRWVDTPGLDADATGEDDRRATDAVWQEADVHLFVHNIREGELSESEKNALAKIDDQAYKSGRPLFVVLTKIDGQEQEEINGKVEIITERLPRKLPVFLVSSLHYANGKKNNKPILVQRSGIEPLLLAINKAAESVEKNRIVEKGKLANGFSGRMRQGQSISHAHLEKMKAEKTASIEKFRKELSRLQKRFHSKLN